MKLRTDLFAVVVGRLQLRNGFPVPLMAICLCVFSSNLRAEPVDYSRDVKPLLAEKCGSCHGALKQESGLRLDAAKFISRGGDGGHVAVAGDAEASSIIARVSTKDVSERMPPNGVGEPLTQEQRQILVDWIKAKMPAPEDEQVLESPKDHWAYQKIARPEVPLISDSSTAKPLDRFLLKLHAERELKPVHQAEAETLLRRVYLDTIGLPPTVAELDAFVKGPSPAAYESVVDDLLSRPQYGERWGRHWMDVWRYSDWSGYKQALRGSQRHIWHWRDWIIESLNEDKGYDQMVVEMLAGDEVAPLDDSVLRATGFLARNYHTSNRNIWMDAAVEHSSKAFLGMTVDCARCHDHKFDPISQREYYAFRAIFEPYNVRTRRIAGVVNTKTNGIPRIFDKELETPTYLYQRGDEKHPDKEHPVDPNIASILGVPFEINAVDLPVESYFPSMNRRIEKENLTHYEHRLKQAIAALKKMEGTIAVNKESDSANEPTGRPQRPSAPSTPESITTKHYEAILKVMVAKSDISAYQVRYAADRAKYGAVVEGEPTDVPALSKTAANAERQFNYHKARLASFEAWKAWRSAVDSDEKDAKKKTKAIWDALKKWNVARADEQKKRIALKQRDGNYTAIGPVYPKQSSGRRLALAKWITHRDNPLAARVAVNHIWLRHFGSPLVENVFDFGIRSPRPETADVLNWLASEFIESNWSMKHVHRLILTSETYQRASSTSLDKWHHNEAIDPENLTYWRANVRRLESEAIRDSVLQVSGQLDKTFGGADIDFAKGETVPRRSLYFRHAYEKQMLMMTIFDAANPSDCYRRSPSVIPQQALALSNSTLTIAAARKLAQEVHGNHASPERFIRESYRHVLCRGPSKSEMAACLEFLESQQVVLQEPATLKPVNGKTTVSIKPNESPQIRARENLIHVLMNHNDFVTVR